MIRAARMTDVPAMVELGRLMHAESPRFSRLAYSHEKVADTLEALIESEDGFAWVAEAQGELFGGMLALLDEHWASHDRLASELVLFVRPDRRGALAAAQLIERCKAWARERGAKWLQGGSSTGVEPERCAALYERFGFTRSTIGFEVLLHV